MQSIRFFSALRDDAQSAIEHIGSAEIVVGIPAFWSMESVEHVIRTVIEGAEKYYPQKKVLIFVADGGSTDDTREVALKVVAEAYNVHVLVSIYRGLAGKGSAIRAIFEAAQFLKAECVALFDSDLRSITPEWVKNVVEPVLEGYDFVAPDYLRHKFDGTITNTIAYNLTRALYGYNVRQPIGGDFGISAALLKRYMAEDIWETDIARFGIDVWLTTLALVSGARVCQTRLGVKVHGEKDPAADLGPMFRQVVGTIFTLMEYYVEHWKKKTSTAEVEFYGELPEEEPPELTIDNAALIEYFKLGYSNFATLWNEQIDEEDFKVISELASQEEGEPFRMPTESWVRIVYRYAILFHNTERQRFKILDMMIPLYYARVASLVETLSDKSSREAEAHYEEHAAAFEKGKNLLIENWNNEEKEEGESTLNDYFTRIWR
jgi:glycosyltransferase involved in cell wall biosynthesis